MVLALIAVIVCMVCVHSFRVGLVLSPRSVSFTFRLFSFGSAVPSLLTRMVRHMAKHKYRRVIVVYPNSGEQWDAQHASWKERTGCTNEEFADRIVEAIRLVRSEWKDLGNDSLAPKMIVGGCCRTSPSTIRHIRKRLDTLQLTQLP